MSNKLNKALMLVASDGNDEAVEVLIKAGANVNACYCNTLEIASRNGYLEVVKLLLDAGAVYKDYALVLASEYGNFEIVKLLLDAGADPYYENGKALSYAKKSCSNQGNRKCFREVVELLEAAMKPKKQIVTLELTDEQLKHIKSYLKEHEDV